MAEFTGERVIAGKVDVDLWNEHLARYLFAARLCRGKKTIDLGCGSGYGPAELARFAESVVGVDNSAEAVEQARRDFPLANLRFEVASLDRLPFEDGQFHLGVCFEVIEHLSDFRGLLSEARRVLSPAGQLIVSTPNVHYYAESRRLHGPNPFHQHEFAYEEFREALSEFFPHQTFFIQNHASGLVFLPLEGQVGSELRLEATSPKVEEAHFFVAVCAARPLMGSPSFVYVPTAANVLREREHHIVRLEGELQTKNAWLDAARAEHSELVGSFRLLQTELEAKNRWALEQNERVTAAAAVVQRLEGEMEELGRQGREVVAGYEAQIAELSSDLSKQAEWARSAEARLTEQIASIAAHVRKLDGELKQAAVRVQEYQLKLDEAEASVIERTKWAQAEALRREAAEATVAAIQGSRWIRMGKAFGLGPKLS